MAREALAGFTGKVLVLYGDVPLIEAATASKLALSNDAMAVLGFEPESPKGYGRLIRNPAGQVIAIREELDATPEERKIGLCNSGILSIDADLLWKLLPRLSDNNAKHELYLTDLVGLTVAEGLAVGLEVCPAAEVAGVNDRIQLAGIEAELQRRYRRQHMLNGATLVSPETVYFSADTIIGQDVVIEPHVIFGPGVTVGDGAEILGFSHFTQSRIGAGARVGPFARLRPGADIGENAHIGNFVEIKNSTIGKGAKANHLSYIGDASVGSKTNVGAGTIVCNYDGYEKHRTEIGAEVFIGSNTSLVAPLKIGDGANIAAGSVVTKEVPANALAISRVEQQVREGWAIKYREIRKARKAAKAKR
jgi:bifunctional UDP-N-acetylglucosamine pyrophosphorylase/glucosamine-1-phosphate N-acetyltransferase